MDLREAGITNFIEADRHPWELARFEVIYSFIKKIIVEKPEPIRVLDIGCGDTFFLEQLATKYKNIKFFAVDNAFTDTLIKKYLEKHTKSELSIKLYKSIEEYKKENNSPIDIVLLLDVIEHIDNDSEFLQNLQNIKGISKNTNIIITVPAFQSLFSSHDSFLGHYRRYNKKQLTETLTNSGFKNQKTGYFFLSLLFIRILQVLVEKIVKPDMNKGIGAWKNSRIKDVILKNILIVDYKIISLFQKIGIKLPGLTTYSICKKSVL